ncbi:Zeta toxin [Pseudomonas mucidolens]|uniref:Zeta toxin n=2 Tax=Pseudomonas mucidolens TaxID=46679 RepID=A0A1H2M109_9PSED|nr:Zeta toxin [Pseudomonas mucidolens]SQH34820.1 UDP-N-acetylglucosamine kinase [Pseudomonas mucidolens]
MPADDLQNSRILTAAIKELAAHATPRKHPQMHIITGQMGAGKSTATSRISEKLDGALIIDYDDLKRFVPGYSAQACKGYPGTVPGSKETARYLVEGLKNYGFDNRLNMVVQESINTRDDEMFKLVKSSRDNGYHVSLTILAVDKATSTMGVLSRYESGLKNINQGSNSAEGARCTPMNYHEDAYTSLTDPQKLNRLLPELHEVVVRGRGAETYYQSSGKVSADEIVEAIERGRASSQTDPSGLFEKLAALVAFNLQFRNPELRCNNV